MLLARRISPERQSRTTHNTSCPTSGWSPSRARIARPFAGQYLLQPSVVRECHGQEFVVPVEQVGDTPFGHRHLAAHQMSRNPPQCEHEVRSGIRSWVIVDSADFATLAMSHPPEETQTLPHQLLPLPVTFAALEKKPTAAAAKRIRPSDAVAAASAPKCTAA
jgi:hypothetical protein